MLLNTDKNNGHGIGRGGRGNGTGNRRRLGGRQEVRVQGGPAGWGRAGRPRKHSSVSRECIGTSTVVRGKGEGGRGGHTETGTTIIDEDSRASYYSYSLGDATSLSMHQGPQDHRGGRRLLRPPAHTQTKYYQPHRSGGAKLQTSGCWTGNQGQHGIGRKSVGRLKKNFRQADGGWKPALLEVDGNLNNKRTERGK